MTRVLGHKNSKGTSYLLVSLKHSWLMSRSFKSKTRKEKLKPTASRTYKRPSQCKMARLWGLIIRVPAPSAVLRAPGKQESTTEKQPRPRLAQKLPC